MDIGLHEPNLSDPIIDIEFVKDIWGMVNRLYSKLEDELRIVDMRTKASRNVIFNLIELSLASMIRYKVG